MYGCYVEVVFHFVAKSSLPHISKFVNPDDTETVHVQIISITECVS